MASRPRPSTRSSNPKTTKKRTGGKPAQPPRAQRAGTTEGRAQQKRAPKTHPTRNPGGRRKDKRSGDGVATPSSSAAAARARQPQAGAKRREKRGQKRRLSPS